VHPEDQVAVRRFEFAFSPLYRVCAAPFGVWPATAYVTLDDEFMTARFGPWVVRTLLINVVDARLSGGFRLLKTIGPAHLSLADHGLTMATNSDRAVCLLFLRPVGGLEPTGRIRHPGLTVTVADCDGLIAAVADLRGG
jgi:hypothetical protein